MFDTKMRNGRWVDRATPKHKHDYCIPVVVRVLFKMSKSYSMFYSAMKCIVCSN